MSTHTHTARIPLPQISLSKPHFPQAKYIKSEGQRPCVLSSCSLSSSVLPVICRAVACDCAQQTFSAKGHMVSTYSTVSSVLSAIAQLSGVSSPSLHMCVLWGGSTTWILCNFPGCKKPVLSWFPPHTHTLFKITKTIHSLQAVQKKRNRLNLSPRL